MVLLQLGNSVAVNTQHPLRAWPYPGTAERMGTLGDANPDGSNEAPRGPESPRELVETQIPAPQPPPRDSGSVSGGT